MARRTTITTAGYAITLIPHSDPGPSVVYIEDAIAEAIDPELHELTVRESELGDRRWSERGVRADVDSLYDQLNARIMAVKTGITREVVIPRLARQRGVVVPAASHEGIHFDRNAGCELCPCSPGVIVPQLRMGGRKVQVSVKQATTAT